MNDIFKLAFIFMVAGMLLIKFHKKMIDSHEIIYRIRFNKLGRKLYEGLFFITGALLLIVGFLGVIWSFIKR